MFDLQEIRGILAKEFKLEMKSKNVIMSTFLYVFSTVFICYLALQRAESSTWNALIWVIVVFALTNAANRIFFYESGDQRIYLYTLASAGNVIAAKLIYQWMISGILALLVLISWSILFNYTINNYGLFLIVLLLGVWSMSNVLTLNNALASNTGNSPTVLAILSFPLLLPVLLTTIKASSLALLQNPGGEIFNLLLVLVLLNVLTAGLSVILFQYLWRY